MVGNLLGERADFDVYAGRRLYAHLYDLGCDTIAVTVEGHHMIYDELREEFERFLTAPRRFTYSPLIIAVGRKPGG